MPFSQKQIPPEYKQGLNIFHENFSRGFWCLIDYMQHLTPLYDTINHIFSQCPGSVIFLVKNTATGNHLTAKIDLSTSISTSVYLQNEGSYGTYLYWFISSHTYVSVLVLCNKMGPFFAKNFPLIIIYTPDDIFIILTRRRAYAG